MNKVFALDATDLNPIWHAAVLLIGIASPIAPQAHSAAPPVTAIAISPDGRHVLVGSQKGIEVRSWGGLDLVREISVALPNVHDLQFSPDGRLLGVAGGTPSEEGSVVVLHWPACDELFRSMCHDDLVYALAWSRDGKRLATASADNACKVLAIQNGKAVTTLAGHSKPTTSVCFIANDANLVTGGIDQSLRVWDAGTGQLIRTMNNHTRPVNDIAFPPRMSLEGALPMIVSVGRDRTIRFWQPTIGRMIRFARLDSVPLAIVWFPSTSRVAASCADGNIRVVQLDTVKVTHELPGVQGWAHSLAVHPEGDFLVVGGTHGQLVSVAVPGS